MLEIMTERCCLRPMTDADFPALCRYLQDPGVMYAYGHAFSDREVWDWLRRQQARYVVPGYGALAVELRETGEMIGQCGITMQDCAGVTAFAVDADALAQTLAENLFALHIDQLVLQAGRTAVDNQNFHGISSLNLAGQICPFPIVDFII